MNVGLITIFDDNIELLFDHYVWHKRLGFNYFHYVIENSSRDVELELEFLCDFDENLHFSTNYHCSSDNYQSISQQLLPEIPKMVDFFVNVDLTDFLQLKKHQHIQDFLKSIPNFDIISYPALKNTDKIDSKVVGSPRIHSQSIWKRRKEFRSFSRDKPNFKIDFDPFWITTLGTKVKSTESALTDFKDLKIEDSNIYSTTKNKLKKKDSQAVSLKSELSKIKNLFFDFKEKKEKKEKKDIDLIKRSEVSICLCFYGITRSLTYTHKSIKNNILRPLSEIADFSTYAHFYDIDHVNSIRSRENDKIDKNQFRFLNYERLILDTNTDPYSYCDYELIKKHGDAWENDFTSLKNLILQLNSISKVTSMQFDDNSSFGHDICLFLRPDLTYHTNFKYYLLDIITKFIKNRESHIYIPDWQHYKGINDRFAICVGKKAINAYGRRLNSTLQYCVSENSPLHSENLVKFVLEKSRITPQFVDIKASRTRANGHIVNENFMRKFR